MKKIERNIFDNGVSIIAKRVIDGDLFKKEYSYKRNGGRNNAIFKARSWLKNLKENHKVEIRFTGIKKIIDRRGNEYWEARIIINRIKFTRHRSIAKYGTDEAYRQVCQYLAHLEKRYLGKTQPGLEEYL